MELIIVRHGIAEEREDFAKKGLEDHLRPLTLKGRKKMQKVCVELREHVKSIDAIVSSPYTRARQTAEIISQIYYETKVYEAPELVPHAPPGAFVKWMRTQAKKYKRLVVVGHEPHLSAFASYMLTGKSESFIDLKKSGVICLQMESFAHAEAGAAELMWYVPPRFFVD